MANFDVVIAMSQQESVNTTQRLNGDSNVGGQVL
jgi:hypothetical protein